MELVAATRFQPSAGLATYSMVDLGTLGGTDSFGQFINARGEVAGYSTLASGHVRPFFWQSGVLTNVGQLSASDDGVWPTGLSDRRQVIGTSGTPGFSWQGGGMVQLDALGSTYSAPQSVNNAGLVVGFGLVGSVLRAYAWERGRPIDLGTLGGPSASAVAVNERDQIVGQSTTASGEQHAFLWQRGHMLDLGTLGGSASSAQAINDSGQVIGSSSTADGSWHSFLWERGQMVDIGAFSALFINRRGQIAGLVRLPNLWPHPALWENGVLTDLGTLPTEFCYRKRCAEAHGLNDRGQVVGSSLSADGTEHAFVWDHGTLLDLGTPGVRSVANAINNSGQIAGFAEVGSGSHAVLWNPSEVRECDRH